MSVLRTYRQVEYAIRRHGMKQYEWSYSCETKNSGVTAGTLAKADAECRRAIDAMLSPAVETPLTSVAAEVLAGVLPGPPVEGGTAA